MHAPRHRTLQSASPSLFRQHAMAVAISQALLIGAAGLIVSTPVAAQSSEVKGEQRRQYAIPPGSLESALVRFAQESGVMISYSASEVAGRQSPGVSGQHSVSDALRTLFRGSGMQAVAQPNGGYTLQSAVIEETTLPAVQVSGTQLDEDATAQAGYRTNRVTSVGPWEGRSLQDTPYSINVMPTELIENLQAITADQVYRVNPTTQLTWPQSQNDTPYVYMRGFQVTQPARNGLPGAQYGHGTSMDDVERIEVLTGLSGFLYGTGNVGGLINYISKRPTATRYNSITTGYSGGSNGYIHGDFGGPIDDEGRFGYRINAVVQDGETSINDASIKKNFVSAAFDWKVTNRLLVQVDGSYRDYESQRQAYWAVASGATRPSAELLDPNKLWSHPWTFFDVESKRLGTNIRWDATDELTLRASYLKRRDTRSYSFSTNTIQPNGTYNQSNTIAAPQDMQAEAWNAFADFNFKTGSVRHKLTTGYLATRNTRYDHVDGSSSFNRTGLSLSAPSYIPEPAWAPYGQKVVWNSSINRQNNWILGDDITFNDQWSMLVGANRATIDSDTRTSPTAAWQQSYKKSATTPTISLIFKPVSYVTTYATYMESLESGGMASDLYNGFAVTNARQVLSPLISKQLEAGVKASVGGLELTAALFEIKKGLQYYDVTLPSQPTYVQDGLQVHKGIELTATGKVSRDWTLIGGATFLDASVKEQKQDPRLEGKKPTGTAEQFFKLYAEYAVPALQGLTLSGGFNIIGSAWGDTLNTDRLPGYTLVDVGARYTLAAAGYPLTLRLNINNLTDKRYWVNSSFLGDARSVVLSANLKF